MNSVVRPWLAERCTWKQQTVLLSALRGCDGRPKNDPSNPFKKKMRYTLLQDADSSTGFMKGELSLNVNTSREIREFFTGCMDSYPMHFFLHFLHAAEIVAYKHPDNEISKYWNYFYGMGVHAMHLNRETEEQLDARLSDSKEKPK